MASSSIFWFRRDLRLNDNPALLAAIAESEAILPVFILDPKLIKTAGSKRLAYLGQSLHHLDDSLGNKLHVIAGDQIAVLKELMSKMMQVQYTSQLSMNLMELSVMKVLKHLELS